MMTRDPLLEAIASLWQEADPVPEGLVGRMQAVAAAEAALADAALDYELMLLVERSAELAGARSAATTYTLRFGTDGLDLLVRIAASRDGSRLDGWLVPPTQMQATATRTDDSERTWSADVDEHGRFSFTDLPPGLYRVWLSTDDGARPFGTPTFEI